MSHILSQSLSQQLRMEQRLTPQLIQSMTVLQKPVADLEAYVEEALETNAALELDEHEATDRADDPRDPARTDGRGDEDAGFARLERYTRSFVDQDVDWVDHRPVGARPSGDDRDAKLGAMANTAGRDASLHEHLLSQWHLLDLDDETRRAGETIITQLDPDGYLRRRLDTLADSVRPPLTVESLEKALTHVHQLEPPGVGARDVVECLLLQLEALPGDNRIERTLIQKHLMDIAHNRLPAVARTTGYGVGEIQEAMNVIRSTLHLHPGYLVGDRSAPRVRPDVIVDYSETGNGIEVRLARGNMPKLRIRDEVLRLAKSRDNGKDERDFARKHVDEASALIEAINFRRSRLLEVSRSVAEKQREFFDVGPPGLKICRMSELAEELSCDPSTISRTVADKYMQTPRGIYPLRYFFTGGMETDDGESVGWDRVKMRVRELIEGEEKQSPLNDDQIVELLKKEGIEISRRTVAKYRQQLDIPNARQRRVF
jgi:RNA polymerase sigma-54 factor